MRSHWKRPATPEAPQKWSIAAVLQHLADAELVWAYRIRMVLAEERPAIIGYDQDRLAARLHYQESDVREARQEFAAFRRANLRVLDRLTADDWQRVGVHAEVVEDVNLAVAAGPTMASVDGRPHRERNHP